MTSPQQRNRPGGKKNHEKKPSLEPAGRMARAADGLDRSCSGVPDRRRSSHTGKRYRPEPVRNSPGVRRNALAAEVRVPVGEPAVRRLGSADADRFVENRAPRDGAASGIRRRRRRYLPVRLGSGARFQNPLGRRKQEHKRGRIRRLRARQRAPPDSGNLAD